MAKRSPPPPASGVLPLAGLLVASACSASGPGAPTPADAAPAPSPTVVVPTAPPWPAPEEAPAPAGLHWATIRHHTIHARMLLPDGVEPGATSDEHNYPLVRVSYDARAWDLELRFSAGAEYLADVAAGADKLGNLPLRRVARAPTSVAVAFTDGFGAPKVLAEAPGVKCEGELARGGDAATEAALDELAFTLCSSVRSPAPGPWRPGTDVERAAGFGVVPDGAWVEPGPSGTPGEALRARPWRSRMYLGSVAFSFGECPTDRAALAASDLASESVTVTERGDALVRRVVGTSDGKPYAGPTNAWVPAGAPAAGRCCHAMFPAALAPPDDAALDYALALCRAQP